MSAAVKCLQGIGCTLDSNGVVIPASRMFVTEFAASSSLQNGTAFGAMFGNNTMTFGDKLTPTLDPNGQNQWLVNTLCGFSAANVIKSAYWSLYDQYSLWSQAPFSFAGQDLAWRGYWGLKYEQPPVPSSPSSQAKPSWTTLSSYYGSFHNASPTFSCNSAFSPAVAIQSSAGLSQNTSYITTGQTLPVTYTATEASQLLLKQGSQTLTTDGSRSCLQSPLRLSCPFVNKPLGAMLEGSCGDSTATVQSGNGQSLSLIASSAMGTSSSTLGFSVGTAPIISGIVDLNGSIINSAGAIIISGAGFSISGNIATFSNQQTGTFQYYYGTGPGRGMLDSEGRTQIQLPLYDRSTSSAIIPAGSWTVQVINAETQVASSGFSLIVH